MVYCRAGFPAQDLADEQGHVRLFSAISIAGKVEQPGGSFLQRALYAIFRWCHISPMLVFGTNTRSFSHSSAAQTKVQVEGHSGFSLNHSHHGKDFKLRVRGPQVSFSEHRTPYLL